MIIIAFPIRHHAVQLIHQLCFHLHTHTDKDSAKRCGYVVTKSCPTTAASTQSADHSIRTSYDLLEVAVFPLLPVHHVVENWDHNISDLSLRHQGDAKERTHHSWDEVGLVVSWITQIHTVTS